MTTTNCLVHFSKTISVHCENYTTKHMNTLRAQNKDFWNIKADGTYLYHWALKGWRELSHDKQRTRINYIELWTCFYQQRCSAVLEVETDGTLLAYLVMRSEWSRESRRLHSSVSVEGMASLSGSHTNSSATNGTCSRGSQRAAGFARM